MKAAIFIEPGKIAVQERPRPQLQNLPMLLFVSYGPVFADQIYGGFAV